MTCAKMLAAAVLVLPFASLMAGAPAMAQEPSSRSLCDLPEYEGTAIYEKYCGGDSGGRDRDYNEPSFDPQADARGRIGALIRNYADIIDQSAWSGVNFDGATNLDAGLANLRHQVWAVLSKAELDAAEQHWLSQYARPIISKTSQQLLDNNQALANMATALDEAAKSRATIEDMTRNNLEDAARDDVLSRQADMIWLKERNNAIKALRTAMPKIQGLLQEAANTGALKRAPSPYVTSLPIDAMPQPLGGFVAPRPISGLPLAAGHYVQAAEPPSPSDLTARVGEIESLAASARNSLRNLRAARSEADTLRQNYDRVSNQVEATRQDLEAKSRELDYQKKFNDYLYSKELSSGETLRLSAWHLATSAGKAMVWDIFTEKALMPVVRQLPYYAAAERANKVGALAKQFVSIEQDFELLSASAAKTLALGSTPDSENVMEQVWGASHDKMEETVNKTLDLLDADEAYDGWKAFFAATR